MLASGFGRLWTGGRETSIFGAVLGQSLVIVSDAHGMRAQEIHLQFADLISGDSHVAELAHSGRDGVGDLVVADQRVDHRAGPVNRSSRFGIEEHGTVFHRDFANRLESQIVSVDV